MSPDHLQVFVAEEFPQVLQLVGVLADEVGGERVPQAVHAQTTGPFEGLRLFELRHHVVEVDLQGVRVPGLAVAVQEDRSGADRGLGAQPDSGR